MYTYTYIHTHKAFNVKDRGTLESAAGKDLFHHCSLHHLQIAINRWDSCLSGPIGSTQPCLGSRLADFSHSLPLFSAAAQFRHQHQHVGADGQARAWGPLLQAPWKRLLWRKRNWISFDQSHQLTWIMWGNMPLLKDDSLIACRVKPLLHEGCQP